MKARTRSETHAAPAASALEERRSRVEPHRIEPHKERSCQASIEPVHSRADDSPARALRTAIAGNAQARRLARLQRSADHSSRVMQRLSFNLQPEDAVITAIVRYASETLGVKDDPQHLGEAGERQSIGESENIYLFGHGGTSDITLEENDLFAGTDMTALATRLAASVTFPSGYKGVIYLVGCTTNSLVESLRRELEARTEKRIDVRGTTEKLQTADEGGIVLREAPESEKEASMREYIDMQRRYVGNLGALKRERAATIKALADATAFDATVDAVMQVDAQGKRIKLMLELLDKALAKLSDAKSVKLGGRSKGLEQVRDAYRAALKNQEHLEKSAWAFVTLHSQKGKDEDVSAKEKPILESIENTLTADQEALDQTVQIMALQIQMHDSKGVLKATPFSLEQMTGSKTAANK